MLVWDPPHRLVFPLADGRYYVGQGGNNPIMNAHNSNPAQQYALDITELNAASLRTSGLYPSEPDKYVIFGETIHGPCNGTVVTAVDGLPDHNPLQTDTENLAGNAEKIFMTPHVYLYWAGLAAWLIKKEN